MAWLWKNGRCKREMEIVLELNFEWNVCGMMLKEMVQLCAESTKKSCQEIWNEWLWQDLRVRDVSFIYLCEMEIMLEEWEIWEQ